MTTTLDLEASSVEVLWPTFGPQVCRWIERSLVHGEGDSYGQPFRLRDDQRLLLYRWYEYEADSNGNFVAWRYDELLLECATGYGKTELGAADALAELCGPTAPETPNIPVAAASYEQADLLFGRAKQIAEHRDCLIRPFVEVYDTEIVLKGKPGKLFRIAAVAGTNEGGIPTLFMADEIHEWIGNKERLHLVVRKSLRKRKGGRTFNMTTPGHDLDSMAGRKHQAGVEGRDPRLLHIWITADPTLDLTDPVQLRQAIEQANPWKTPSEIDTLVVDFETMPEHEFRRYHLCQWVSAPEDSWLKNKPGAWESCIGPAKFTNRGRTAVGIDMSLRYDTTSVSITEASDKKRTKARIWTAPKGGKVDHLEVMDYVRRLCREHDVDAVVYDPRFLEVMGRTLEDEGIPMVEFPQSPERMGPACQMLYDDILTGEIEHDGDPELAAHVAAAVMRETDRGWTLTKGRSKGPIDGCIATVMSNYEASQADDEEPAELVSF